LVEIAYNDVDAGQDGVIFKAKTSNAVDDGSHTPEILIRKNTVVGGRNGINFEGKAEGETHDIEISENYLIKGETEDGIVHTGSIDDAELWILGNKKIYGDRDGVHIEGHFYNDAKITIDNNGNGGGGNGISTDDGD